MRTSVSCSAMFEARAVAASRRSVASPQATCTGVILAGGNSSRMGQPKHAMRLTDERTLIDLVADRLKSVCRCVVVVGPGDVMPDLPHVHDLRPGCGPLGGIEALLASGIDSHYLVCPCDLPFVTAELLRMLAEPTDELMTVFQIDGEETFDPLPARVAADALPSVRQLLDSGRHAVHELARVLHARRVLIPQTMKAALQNINTPSDLDAARRRPADSSAPQQPIHQSHPGQARW